MKRLVLVLCIVLVASTAWGANFYWKDTKAALDAIEGIASGDRGVVITSAGAMTFYHHNGSAWVASAYTGAVTGAVTGNASTATALAADPANCSAGEIALGVNASGVAECTATPSVTTLTGALIGNASTASALAADPADCPAGQVATGIAASGALTCTASPTLTTVTAASFVSTALDNTRGVTVPNTADPTTTNLAAGKMWVTDNCVRVRNNDNTVTFSAGCQIESFPFGIDNVVAGDDILLWKVPQAISIVSVTCAGSTADDIIGVLQECTAADQTSCSDLDSTDWTITNAAGGNTVLAEALEDAAIAAGAWLKWNTESVETANSSKLACTVQYTR